MATGTRYAGKVVVVTGGGRGIGAGIARAFVQNGAQVVICDKDESGGRALEQELTGTVFILCDVTREKDVQTLISETVRRFGRLDCVVNNAGYHPPPQWPEETSAEGFRQLLELNLLGTYTVTKFALPHLRKSQGNIINISSLVGAIGQVQAVPYVATKGAVTAMTKALALDESRYGVRVNCISPGNIWTPMWEGLAALTPDPAATVLQGTMNQPPGHLQWQPNPGPGRPLPPDVRQPALLHSRIPSPGPVCCLGQRRSLEIAVAQTCLAWGLGGP
uniref:Hydroxysteroid 17-beta dehydrogenase 14 n=2 Tax=Canis lupus familiaris TaxID=9615 RepID=A0A8I3MIF1_CANLF